MEKKKQPQYETTYMTCACHSPEHTLRFNFDGVENEIYTEVFLNQYRGFFKRLWIAIKYLCGYRCRFGHFDCYTMSGFSGLEQAKRLHKMLTTWIEGAEFRVDEITNKVLSRQQREVLEQYAEKMEQAQASQPPQPYCKTCGVDPSQKRTEGCEDKNGCGYWRSFLAWYEENEARLAQIRKQLGYGTKDV